MYMYAPRNIIYIGHCHVHIYMYNTHASFFLDKTSTVCVCVRERVLRLSAVLKCER